MKPHEQTWHVVDGREYHDKSLWRDFDKERLYTFSPDPESSGWQTDDGHYWYGLPREVAQLAAAAPELARALLAVEWVNHYDGATEYPWCHAVEDDGHDDDCARQAALRKAGVR